MLLPPLFTFLVTSSTNFYPSNVASLLHFLSKVVLPVHCAPVKLTNINKLYYIQRKMSTNLLDI